MSRSSDRGQVEPTAALVVLLAVCGAVSMYAVALENVDGETTRDLASPTLDRVADRIESGGVVQPTRLNRAREATPEGYHGNVTVAAAGERWTMGPTPPGRRGDAVDTAARRLSIRLAPGRVRPGRVRVVVWS